MRRGGARFIPRADALRAVRADPVPVSDFEQLRGIAMMSPHTHAALRYVREREAGRKPARSSSRAQRTDELAAAARAKHRGLFARLAAPPSPGEA
jgi:hypothetical protein